MATYKQTMTIAQTASVDIPKPRNSGSFTGRDTFAAVAARSLPTDDHDGNTHHHHHHHHQHQPGCMLPTPPNSISPCLPPQRYLVHDRQQPGAGHPPTPHALDSDVDVPDEQGEHHPREDGDRGKESRRGDDVRITDQDPPTDSNSEVDATGAITPALLAKHHLPDILLTHGPLAIRHVMSYLTISVPGFSQIPSAKARRLVVAALEGRGADDKRLHHGNVVFEKVGWGRWDARMKGEPPRTQAQQQQQHHSSHPEYSPPASYTHSGVHPPHLRQQSPDPDNHRLLPRPVDHGISAGASWTEDSVVYSHEDASEDGMGMDFMGGHKDDHEPTMLEHEADKMSLDGDSSSAPASSASPELDEDDEDGNGEGNEEDDATDDEDWAKIGAAALRQASLLQMQQHGRRGSSGHGFPLRMRERRAGGCREGRGGLTHSYQQPFHPISTTTTTTPYSIPGRAFTPSAIHGGGPTRGVPPHLHSMPGARMMVGGGRREGVKRAKKNNDDDDNDDEMVMTAENNNTQEREAIEALVALSSI